MPAQQTPQYRLPEIGSPLEAKVQESVFGYKPITTVIFMLVLLANK